MSETTTAPETATIAAPANGDKAPETKPADDLAAKLEVQAAKLAEYEAAEKRRAEAAMSEAEKLAKRTRELDEREALQTRSEQFAAAGLPREWAKGVEPAEIARYIAKQIKAGGASQAGGGDPVIAPPHTITPTPSGNPKDAPFKNLAAELRKKSRGI